MLSIVLVTGSLAAPAASVDAPWPSGSPGELRGEEEMLTHKVCKQDDERS